MVLVVLVLILATVLVRVGRLQTSEGETLRAEGAQQWTRRSTITADRGNIFDRNGEELAVSVPARTVSINPELIENPQATADTLASILHLSPERRDELLKEMIEQDRGFVYVARQVDVAVGDQLEALNLAGVDVISEDKRILPGGDTGRSVIGRTDIDGIGTAGLELQYNDLLTGSDGETSREVAPGGRSIAGTESVSITPVPGDDLILTLDRSIQFATEEALLRRVAEIQARGGTAIVMDNDTGEIYAMASVRRDDAGVVEITSGNFAAVDAYEPGSVAKVITIAAGINEGVVTADTSFVVPWRKEYGDDLLKDSHQHPDEAMTVEQILVASSNIGTIMVQQEVGRERHWEYMREFGLGEPTALDFPGESTGILKNWDELWGSERVTVAYGQGVSSTSIQLAAAVNTIANGGTYVAPLLVKSTIDRAGNIIDRPASTTQEVVSPTTAKIVQQMMAEVVCRGTAKYAQVDGFNVAGKTGTGLKAQPNGTYQNAAGEYVYYASFVGFFPAEDPQVTVLVSIDEPPAGDINRFGGTAAGPVFAELAPTVVHELGIQPPADTVPCGTK